MREFHLGIIGGCLTHQPGIPMSQLYHRQLGAMLSERCGLHLKIHVAREFERDAADRLDTLLGQSKLDAVMVHVRHDFTRKARLVVIITEPERVRYVLHPSLFRRNRHDWTAVERQGFPGCRQLAARKRPVVQPAEPAAATAQPSDALRADTLEMTTGATRILGMRVRDLFHWGGWLVGLANWAMRDELQLLANVRSRCAEAGLRLIVMGSSRRPDDRWLDNLCQQLDRRLRKEMSRSAIPYCSLDQINDHTGRRMIKPDGFHFTAEGHRYVAEKLGEVLLPVLLCSQSSRRLPNGG